MKIHDAVKILPRDLRQLELSVGGKFGLLDRLLKGGTGSPMLYYLGGNADLDRLQSLSSGEIRINFELFKAGLFLRVAERNNPYFFPIPIDEIVSVRLFMEKAKMGLNLLLANGEHLMFWGSAGIFKDWEDYIERSILKSKRRLYTP